MTLTPCLACGTPTSGPRCPPCASKLPRAPRQRTDAHARRSWRWRRLSERVRNAQPWCESCGATSQLSVDHRVPLAHGGAEYDPSNLRVLCTPCHNRSEAARRRDYAERPPAEPNPPPSRTVSEVGGDPNRGGAASRGGSPRAGYTLGLLTVCHRAGVAEGDGDGR